jgi:hypothetical protein
MGLSLNQQYRIRTVTHAGQSVMIGTTAVSFDASGLSEPVSGAVVEGIQGVPGYALCETTGALPFVPPVPPLPQTTPIRITVRKRNGETLGEADLLGSSATLLVDLPAVKAEKGDGATAQKSDSAKAGAKGTTRGGAATPPAETDAKQAAEVSDKETPSASESLSLLPDGEGADGEPADGALAITDVTKTETL